MDLAKVEINKIAKVIELEESHFSSRLADIGFFPGQKVKVIHRSPFGDPIAIRIGESTFSLRINEAKTIKVELSND